MDEMRIRDVARMLHEVQCHGNHSDGCRWFYSKWCDMNVASIEDAITGKLVYLDTRETYYVRAQRLLQRCDYHTIKDILSILHGYEFIWEARNGLE